MAIFHLVILSTVLLVHVARGLGEQDPLIETDKGTVRGFLQTLPDGNEVQTFLGIPFAAPPLGELRFKPPTQLDPWEGVLNATMLPNSCMQGADEFFGDFSGSTMWNANTDVSEDCLYLNVWVPKQSTTKPKPVIAWIFGGGFYSGTSTLDIYDGKYLAAAEDVIVVSMQYRVGSFGFLALDTPEAPGNAGLWDQRMALEWVNRNIHKFGGDPQSVTLMGESAGAVSVGLFLICDLCRGYFHKAILQSGAPGAGWGVLPKEEVWRRSGVLAENVGCKDVKTPDGLVECLRKVDAQTLMFSDFVGTVGGIVQFPFSPIVDGIFIPQDPKQMMNQGHFKKIPILLGSTENEATFFMIYMDSTIFNRETPSPLTPEQYDYAMDDLMFKYFPQFPGQLSDFARQTIKFQYRNWQNPDDGVENRKSVDRAVSDANFVCPVLELAVAYAKQNAPVYYYWFNQRWSANPWPEWMGVLHADEIWFTFGHPLNPELSFTEEERELSRKMMNYWANFARTGNPNEGTNATDWPRFTQEDQYFRILDTESISNGQTWAQYPRTQQCAFWDIFLPKVVEENCRLNDMESNLEEQFKTWKSRYVEGWRDQFNSFLESYRTSAKPTTCQDGP